MTAWRITSDRQAQSKEKNFCLLGGVAGFVQYMNRSKNPLHKPQGVFTESAKKGWHDR